MLTEFVSLAGLTAISASEPDKNGLATLFSTVGDPGSVLGWVPFNPRASSSSWYAPLRDQRVDLQDSIDQLRRSAAHKRVCWSFSGEPGHAGTRERSWFLHRAHCASVSSSLRSSGAKDRILPTVALRR
jgi:hypothetical protein